MTGGKGCQSMSFSAPDPLEQDFGVMCEDMSADQLVSYIISYQQAFGFRLVIDGMKERSIFKGLQRTYGRRDAGLIVKWVFYRYKGRYRDEVVTPLSFSKGRAWFCSKMHLELQEALAAEKAISTEKVSIGAATLADL